MKLGIVGVGNVGSAIALAAVTRGSAREIMLVDRSVKVAEAVATDLRYATPLRSARASTSRKATTKRWKVPAWC
jgi:malate/lactate dehydrogenase